MDIVYKDIHEFSREELEQLFLSVGWSSGHFPDRLDRDVPDWHEAVNTAYSPGRKTKRCTTG